MANDGSLVFPKIPEKNWWILRDQFSKSFPKEVSIGYLKSLLQKSSADGAGLMRTKFSPKNPVLKLNTMANKSEQDEQMGYMDIMAGVMTVIRNPRVHEHDGEDTEERALQLLSLANQLILRVRACTSPLTKTSSKT